MEVRNHCLYEDDGTPVTFRASPNHGDEFAPHPTLYLVIHYTATLSLAGAVNWFRNPEAKVSAHLVIDRDGRAVQMVPFDRQAWHAGKSRWDDRENLNACSIGIEFVNAGVLQRAQPCGWTDWAGHRVPRRDTLVARHKHESSKRRWHAFTPEQLERGRAIAKALHDCYHFTAVLGHDDIAPDRKIDPGPAFPMAQFAADVLGSATSVSTAGTLGARRTLRDQEMS
jgi:N-acetylmuramoyl-L-alanine amidase